MLYKETVTVGLFETLKILMSIDRLSSFRLVDGSAIALQIGHRKSIDIDLFSNEKINKQALAQELKNTFSGIECFITQDGINTRIHDVKVDIFDDWMIPFKEESLLEDGIRITSLKDLAALKLTAFTERREKKDYIDLYFLFLKFGGLSLLEEYTSYNSFLSKKSLLFALEEVTTAMENDSPMPDIITPVSWDAIKDLMHRTAKEYLNTQRIPKDKI